MANEDPFLRTTEEPMVETENQLPDDLVEELDRALDSVTLDFDQPLEVAAPEVVPENGMSADPGIREMQETFLNMSRNTLNPVARYMKAISLGEESRDLLEISEYVVTSMIPRVEQVGLNQHAEDLSFFRSLILLALGEREQAGTEAMKEVVMKGFNTINDRFDLKCRGYRLAVRNLVEFYRALRNSESVSEIDIRRFFSIGVPSLTWVRRTKVAEMTSLSGIEASAMAEIRRLAYVYRSVPPMHSAKLVQEDTIAPSPINPSVVIGDVSSTEVTDAAVADLEDLPPTAGQV